MLGQKSLERSAETRVYVGIDVCKDWLDVDIHPIGRRFRVPNTPEGLKSLKRRIAAMPDALIVMEATAKYHRQPRRTLHAAGYAVAIVNPLRARLFAEAFGQLAKTDKLDARSLASECLKPEARSRALEELEAGQEIVRARSPRRLPIGRRCPTSAWPARPSFPPRSDRCRGKVPAAAKRSSITAGAKARKSLVSCSRPLPSRATAKA
jgi:Transposase